MRNRKYTLYLSQPKRRFSDRSQLSPRCARNWVAYPDRPGSTPKTPDLQFAPTNPETPISPSNSGAFKKLSKILLLSSMLIMGVTAMMSWQQSNVTAAAQRRAAIVATVQPAIAPPATPPNPIAAAPTLPQSPQFIAPAPTTPIPAAAPSPEIVAPHAESPRPVASPVFMPVDQNVQVIKTCNGQLANANLRSEPSLAPQAILGVVPQDQAVSLTGRTAIAPRYDVKRSDKSIGDGEFWHEAIALAPLYPNSDPAATNQTGVGQKGNKAWIADCFVSLGN